MDPETKILVVDDSEMLRDMIVRMLQRAGFPNIKTAADGQQALEMLRARAFGCVISDRSMPVMDGIDLLWKVRSDSVLKDLPFILTSSGMNSDIASLAIKAGASAAIAKEKLTSEGLREILTKL